MSRLIPTIAICALGSLALAPPAPAAFGISEFDVAFTNQDGSTARQAGAHPFAMTTSVAVNTEEVAGKTFPPALVKALDIEQVAGFVGKPTATPRCSSADFLTLAIGNQIPSCADSSAVGFAQVTLAAGGSLLPLGSTPIYNLLPPPRVAAKLGFWVQNVPTTVELGVGESPPYAVQARTRKISEVLEFVSVKFTIWGVPADRAHDLLRGSCIATKGSCPANFAAEPFLTLPRACEGPLASSWRAASWQDPETFLEDSVLTHDEAGNPQGMSGCAKLGFDPEISAEPTTKAATSPTGLDFSLEFTHNEGLTSSKQGAVADADLKKAVVTLPEGFSTNPSLAEGLEVCTQAQLDAETAFSAPGAGCPKAAKVGTVKVETPLLEESIDGALYIAKPYENPFGSLLALYIVIKNPNLGIIVKQPLKVEPNPVTGQLTTVADNLPQLPFSHFRLHFREGTRSPLASPPGCGSYDATAVLTPWSGGQPITTTSTFQIITGPNEGPCPSGGLPPFRPGLTAGSINNAAGRFSPFNMRLFRSDSEQEITHFSIKLPPGLLGKLAGIPFCPDSAIKAAKARTGPHGGQEELDSPSCPAASQVGRTLAGSGVGPALAYAPGKVYLAGPYHGAPVSLVAITAGVVGPFDIGTVLVRLAIKVNPETGEVFLDSTGSDPIPHIVKGIPIHLRDIRASTDRPQFTFNPTSCEPTSTASTVLGSGLDFVSPADDNPFVATSRFQAADCAALPFKPKLSFRLKGSTKRGGNPSLRAHVAMNGFGEAAIESASVALPRSEFLDNAHIGTVCTRVQFREGNVPGENCPAASVYGHVSASTPILEGPLKGPIYLRSSEHPLPDLVAALHHQEINVVLVGRVDSVNGGGIRNTFEFVPDAPVISADFVFDGAAKGLLENSTNICKGKHLATVKLKGHNGKHANYKAPLKPAGCRKHKKSKRG